eukprot:2752827-Amphidinium_carterae.2
MDDTIIKVQHQWMEIDQISGVKGKGKGKGKFKGPPIKGQGKNNKGKSVNYKGAKGKQNQIQYNSDQQKGQQSIQGKGQWQQQNKTQNNGRSEGKSIICWTRGKRGHTSNQWWSGPVYQLDATDSSQPPVPLEPSQQTSITDHSQPSQEQGTGIKSLVITAVQSRTSRRESQVIMHVDS